MFANDPPLGMLVLGDPAVSASTIARTSEALALHGRKAFGRFADAMDIAPARRHLVNGTASTAIPATARSVKAQLVGARERGMQVVPQPATPLVA